MTRRERAEARLQRRREWAASRDAKATAAFQRARSLTDGIPFGQPILVGHHSEKRHRRTLEKSDNAMRAACESSDMAETHRSKAAGISAQLERTIFSDDENAAAECERKAAELDAAADQGVAVNAAWRKHGPKAKKPDTAKLEEALRACGCTDEQIRRQCNDMARFHWLKAPMHSGNVRANARRYRERAKEIRAQEARRAEAEAAGGCVVKRLPPCQYSGTLYAVATFSEYPGRATVDALKAAGFHWSAPSWHGHADKLPACVLERSGEVSAEAPALPVVADDVCPDGPACTDPACMAERERRTAAGGDL